jgi:PIN domain nuclease of toxin-antitoxin system
MTIDHAELAGKLPQIHKDPFDRMLIAQAVYENLTLVTRDEWICKYDVKILKA